MVIGGRGFANSEILENWSLPSPFGEVHTTEMGNAGIMGRDGPAALDSPLEDGKGD